MGYDIYTGLLKAFSFRVDGDNDIRFSCDTKHPKLIQLKSDYSIEAIAGDGDELSKAINLLKWVSTSMYHKGDYAGSVPPDSLSLLQYAYKQGSTCGINCVALSTILTDCLLAIGLQARKVYIMPCSPYDGDNHVVTHVYLNTLHKWIMLDPTFNAYFTNERGEYLSLLDIRHYLADQEPIFFNDEAKYNDEVWTAQSAQESIEYYAKDLFYMQTMENSTFDEGNAPGNRVIILSPLGYDLKQVRLSNINYRMKRFGANPHIQKWLEEVEKEELIYCTSAEFEKAPEFA